MAIATMTPPTCTPITARPHLASGHAGAMLLHELQLTHDPVGSISEPARGGIVSPRRAPDSTHTPRGRHSAATRVATDDL